MVSFAAEQQFSGPSDCVKFIARGPLLGRDQLGLSLLRSLSLPFAHSLGRQLDELFVCLPACLPAWTSLCCQSCEEKVCNKRQQGARVQSA